MINNELYFDDVQNIASIDANWNKLQNCSLLITGASGLMGSFLVDVIMYKNIYSNLGCKIFAVSRNANRASKRFSEYINSQYFDIVEQDINESFNLDEEIDYIIHLASNTHPRKYAENPIETITTNVIGTNNLLQLASQKKVKKFLFASSNEIYGENRGDSEFFDEKYCGFIDCNTLRAGYPESKRCGEALCQAYIKENDVDVVIARLTRSYGPTLLKDDSKAMSQFLKNAVEKNDIVLKSNGEQYYSYTYVADAVSGILTVLLNGKSGEAYNIANEKSDIKLKNLAKLMADYAGVNVLFDVPDEVENVGFSKVTKARLDGRKIEKLGWKLKYSIADGVKRTIDILRDLI